MEVKNVKVNGIKTIYFFNGRKYIFYSPYYGIFAVATLTSEGKKPEGGYYRNFNVEVGNNRTIYLGPSYIQSPIKRIIKKAETQFSPTTVGFTFESKECSHKVLSIEAF